MPRYKRTADEAQLDIPLEPEVAPDSVETRDRLRNMWEFAALMQFIQTFGDALKIDKEVDIEVGRSERETVVCWRERRSQAAVLVDGWLMDTVPRGRMSPTRAVREAG